MARHSPIPVGRAAGLAAGATILAGVLAGPGEVRALRVLGAVLGVVALLLAFLPIAALRRHGRPPPGATYLETTVVVDRGLYALVRHPQYLAYVLFVATFCLLAQHVAVTVFGAVAAGLLVRTAAVEERACVRAFGRDYRAYAARVPRFNLVAGMWRALRRHGGSDSSTPP